MGGFAIAHVVLNWNRPRVVRRVPRADDALARLPGGPPTDAAEKSGSGMTSNPSSRRRGSAGPSSRDAVSRADDRGARWPRVRARAPPAADDRRRLGRRRRVPPVEQARDHRRARHADQLGPAGGPLQAPRRRTADPAPATPSPKASKWGRRSRRRSTADARRDLRRPADVDRRARPAALPERRHHGRLHGNARRGAVLWRALPGRGLRGRPPGRRPRARRLPLRAASARDRTASNRRFPPGRRRPGDRAGVPRHLRGRAVPDDDPPADAAEVPGSELPLRPARGGARR